MTDSSQNQPISVTENTGSVEKAVSGDYSFSVFTVLGEAWQKTSGAKLPIHLAFLYYFLVLLAIMMVFGIAMAAIMTVQVDNMANPSTMFILQFIMQILVNLIALPMMMGIIIMGIKRSVNAPINANSVFHYFSKTLTLLITMILVYIMVILGFLLLILPGIYLMIAYYMALPLVVEKDMSPWQAMEVSRKAVSRSWFRMFGFLFLAGVIIFISAIPLGIGMIWTLPMFIIAYGIIYRNMFGVEQKTITA